MRLQAGAAAVKLQSSWGERDDFGNETVFEKDTYTPLFLEKPMINVCPWN